VAVPSTLIEVVRRVPTDQVEQAYGQRRLRMGDQMLPFYWLGSLLQHSAAARPPGARSRWWWCAVRRSAWRCTSTKCWATRKWWSSTWAATGPPARPGRRDLLPSGAVALIYNPVALASLYGEAAQRRAMGAPPLVASRSRPSRRWCRRRWCWWSTTR
jgi:chemosensory pili system protein ChpA (sensor histidine kinase/response regulator)